MAKRKDPGREIRAQTARVAMLGLTRLESILSDPETANADVFKGVSLLFERVYKPEEAGAPQGDFEIRLQG